MKTLKKKKELVKIAKEHRKFDRFIKGQWINGKVKGKYSGCFFGCMIQSEDNTLQKASEEMHLPLWLVHLSEHIFEKLPQEEAVEFPVQLLEAIPANKDLEYAYKRFFYSMLMDKEKGQIAFTKKGSAQYKAIKQCADLFLMDEIDESAAESAESAARSAWSAARSAE